MTLSAIAYFTGFTKAEIETLSAAEAAFWLTGLGNVFERIKQSQS